MLLPFCVELDLPCSKFLFEGSPRSSITIDPFHPRHLILANSSHVGDWLMAFRRWAAPGDRHRQWLGRPAWNDQETIPGMPSPVSPSWRCGEGRWSTRGRSATAASLPRVLPGGRLPQRHEEPAGPCQLLGAKTGSSPSMDIVVEGQKASASGGFSKPHAEGGP